MYPLARPILVCYVRKRWLIFLENRTESINTQGGGKAEFLCHTLPYVCVCVYIYINHCALKCWRSNAYSEPFECNKFVLWLSSYGSPALRFV